MPLCDITIVTDAHKQIPSQAKPSQAMKGAQHTLCEYGSRSSAVCRYSLTVWMISFVVSLRYSFHALHQLYKSFVLFIASVKRYAFETKDVK